MYDAEQTVNLELVEISPSELEIINNMDYYTYDIFVPISIKNRFNNEVEAYYFIKNVINANGNACDIKKINSKYVIISHKELNDMSYYFFNEDEPIKLMLNKKRIKINAYEDFYSLSKFIYHNLRRNFIKKGFKNYANTIYDPKSNLLNIDFDISNPIDKILSKIKLCEGFKYFLRLFGKKMYIQISPKSVIVIDYDLNKILNDSKQDMKIVNDLITSVSLPIGRKAKLYSILNLTANEIITDRPFIDISFMEFANTLYPDIPFSDKSAKLLYVLPYGKGANPWYFSSEFTQPSFMFTDISYLKPRLYSAINRASKKFSANRDSYISHILDYDLIRYENIEFTSKEVLSFKSELNEVELKNIFDYSNQDVNVLPTPHIDFKNKLSGFEYRIIRGGRYSASVRDILNHNDVLTCFDSPKEIRVQIFSSMKYLEESIQLINNLKNGFETFPSFKELFNTEIIFDEVIPVNDLSEDIHLFENLHKEDIHCGIVFGPRSIPGDKKKSKLIYINPEVAILNQGIPVQYIADDSTLYRNGKTIAKKGYDVDVLFGIGLNILSKIGSKIISFSPETFQKFLPFSIVMGYNIMRIYDDVEENKNLSLKENIKISTPLVAPLVIMSEDGHDLIFQKVYEINKETDLFKGERGEEIINNIPKNHKNIIIHKDGKFFKNELDDLIKLSKERKIIPISIISNNSPRIFLSNQNNRIPPMGTVIRLSEDDYLIITPLISRRYDPVKRGWPNTILISFHDKPFDYKLSNKEKMSMLFQIWALTRIHQGSQIPTRRPISIHYSNSMAKFVRKAGRKHQKFFKEFGNRKNNLGYTPKPFL